MDRETKIDCSVELYEWSENNLQTDLTLDDCVKIVMWCEGKEVGTSEKDLRVCEVIASYSSPIKVAVICLSQDDFLNHEKDSSKDYYPIWGRKMMLGCEFNEIEFTEKSSRNKWLSEIVNSCELRLI